MVRFITYKKSHLLFSFLLSWSVVFNAKAQLGFCPGDKGAPIFQEDFGSGTINGPQLPTGFTTYTYVPSSPEDGFYTVSNNMGQLGSWHQTNDHTPADTNGKAFIVNASFNADQFFNRTISGLCENTFYEFSSWLLNVYDRDSNICGNGEIPINVRFEIWDESNTTLLASGDTGGIPSTSSPVWQQYGLVFQTVAGQNAVILKMLNNGDGGCGNDLAIDDIVFSACGDNTGISSDLSATQDFVSCDLNAPISAILTATPDFSVYNTHAFQWQESTDGNTWTEIVGATGDTYATPPLSTTTYYRVNVAVDPINLGSPLCSSLSDPYLIDIVPVPTAPISNGNETACTDEPIPSLSAIAGAKEEIAWYDALTGGNLLSTGSTYTPLNEGTFYAEAFVYGAACVSPTRTAVSFTFLEVPVFSIEEENLTICIGQETKILNAEIDNVQYNWNTGETTKTIEINEPGDYIVRVTNSLGCDEEKTFVVSPIEPPIFSDQAFSNGSSVTLMTSNQGDFEYSLDGQNYQDSNFFLFVEGGIYTAYARNKDGCKTASKRFHHLDIPKYFTPNNDGYHDTFEVPGLEYFTNSTIRIFDRFGKLIKSSPGQFFRWNGSFLGRALPADDYWYVITIDGEELSGHVSIKR